MQALNQVTGRGKKKKKEKKKKKCIVFKTGGRGKSGVERVTEK
jgi:hypothetical protein